MKSLVLLLLALGACSAPTRVEYPVNHEHVHKPPAAITKPMPATPCVTEAGGAVVIAQDPKTCK